MSEFEGILPAVVTPIDEEGRFRPAVFERLLETVYAAGVDGIYVCGQTGEGLLQTVAQRKAVAETAVRCSPAGKIVIVHVGAHRPEDAIELARHAERIGARAVSSLPPPGGYPFPEVRRYYKALVAATGLPFFIYYFPDAGPAVAGAEQLLELCAIRGVAGVKFTDFNFYMLETVALTGATVFNGRDECLAAGLLMGASGGIGTFYNLAPEQFVELWRHARAGRWSEARCTQRRINALIRLTLQFPMLPAVKTMLRWRGLDCGPCLPPRGPLTEDEERRLRAGLDALG